MPLPAAVTASRQIRGRFVSVLVLLTLLWQTTACVTRTKTDTAASGSTKHQVDAPTSAATLPNTDGVGLLPMSTPFNKPKLKRFFAAGQAACTMGCTTKFGTVLGSANDVSARSNCASTCIHPEYSFLDLDTGEVSVHARDPQRKNLRYVGVVYQCVEYARRWWMKNQGIAFGDVDGAIGIIYLTEGQNIRAGKTFPLARSINGTAQRPPIKGDLIVYYPDPDNPKWRFGHVAVVVDVDLDQGIVSLAEQNYTNAPWQDAHGYSRQIRLFEIGDRYTLVDVPTTDIKNPNGGRIAGWVYPLSAK